MFSQTPDFLIQQNYVDEENEEQVQQYQTLVNKVLKKAVFQEHCCKVQKIVLSESV